MLQQLSYVSGAIDAESEPCVRDFTSPDDFLQDLLFDWLDDNELAGEEANLANVVSFVWEIGEGWTFPVREIRATACCERRAPGSHTPRYVGRYFIQSSC